MPDEKLGERINGIFNQDVQHLTFSDASFDVVTSNQVFEHVPDDIKGYAECLRVLGKWLRILTGCKYRLLF
jgi:ubiquinone/menaquinone biosynthesis C-methylase UbiE